MRNLQDTRSTKGEENNICYEYLTKQNKAYLINYNGSMYYVNLPKSELPQVIKYNMNSRTMSFWMLLPEGRFTKTKETPINRDKMHALFPLKGKVVLKDEKMKLIDLNGQLHEFYSKGKLKTKAWLLDTNSEHQNIHPFGLFYKDLGFPIKVETEGNSWTLNKVIKDNDFMKNLITISSDFEKLKVPKLLTLGIRVVSKINAIRKSFKRA